MEQTRPTWRLTHASPYTKSTTAEKHGTLPLRREEAPHLVPSRQPDRHTSHREAMHKVGGAIDRVYYPREGVFGKLQRCPPSLRGCLLMMFVSHCAETNITGRCKKETDTRISTYWNARKASNYLAGSSSRIRPGRIQGERGYRFYFFLFFFAVFTAGSAFGALLDSDVQVTE